MQVCAGLSLEWIRMASHLWSAVFRLLGIIIRLCSWHFLLDDEMIQHCSLLLISYHPVIIIYSDTIWKVTVNMNATWKGLFFLHSGPLNMGMWLPPVIRNLWFNWREGEDYQGSDLCRMGLVQVCLAFQDVPLYSFWSASILTGGHAEVMTFLVCRHSSCHNDKCKSPNPDHNGGSLGKKMFKFKIPKGISSSITS